MYNFEQKYWKEVAISIDEENHSAAPPLLKLQVKLYHYGPGDQWQSNTSLNLANQGIEVKNR